MKTAPFQQIKIEPSGSFPVKFRGRQIAHHLDMNAAERRGVKLTIFETDGSALIAQLDFVTEDPTERPATYCSGLKQKRDTSLPAHKSGAPRPSQVWPVFEENRREQEERVAEWVRMQADDVLPPGAGHPVTTVWPLAQEKLKGILKSSALHCLTRVLGQLDDLEGKAKASRGSAA
ncbi:hypothetical protein [Mitsuaria sp. 7]|uniref:hypothetical protein n=1 Tax=Mitsuaria sp. 7 TaxID=1658665 RepID=UPI0007DDEA32|nr:hypothetical protein [Mitsuaria sp. 7]ANH68254.1 hypothetical protein ABE85_13025 [Mitsuaria sp. 7]